MTVFEECQIALQQENSNLLKKSSAAKDSQEKLSVSEENCKALKASLEESEERLITIVDSLEREREKNIQVKKFMKNILQGDFYSCCYFDNSSKDRFYRGIL